MKNMVIDDRLLFFGSLLISLSATQFLLQSINVMHPSTTTSTLFATLSAGTKTYFPENFSIPDFR